MIDTTTAIEFMWAELHRIRPPKYATVRLGKVYAIRCPFCGDSIKSDTPHLYIKMTSDSRDGLAYFSYDCKLCPAQRKVFNLQDAKDIGIENPDLLEYIGNLKSQQSSNFQRSGSNIIAKKLVFNTELTADIRFKQEYMWNRLKWKNVCVNPDNYKVIYDLRSFFIKNKLQPNLDYGDKKFVQNMLSYLHNNCIGFLSFDNTHINFRDISPNPPRRYTQYMIYSEKSLAKKDTQILSETSGMYVIPNSINSMSSKLKIVMAEGVFDILRIYSDIYKCKQDSSIIFASVSNSHGYSSCIIKFMEYGLMFDEVEIYSDEDVNVNDYRKVIRPLVPDAQIQIFYNTKAKDLGNICEPMHLSRITI